MNYANIVKKNIEKEMKNIQKKLENINNLITKNENIMEKYGIFYNEGEWIIENETNYEADKVSGKRKPILKIVDKKLEFVDRNIEEDEKEELILREEVEGESDSLLKNRKKIEKILLEHSDNFTDLKKLHKRKEIKEEQLESSEHISGNIMKNIATVSLGFEEKVNIEITEGLDVMNKIVETAPRVKCETGELKPDGTMEWDVKCDFSKFKYKNDIQLLKAWQRNWIELGKKKSNAIFKTANTIIQTIFEIVEPKIIDLFLDYVLQKSEELKGDNKNDISKVELTNGDIRKIQSEVMKTQEWKEILDAIELPLLAFKG
jgi:hypothetical protein